MCNPQKAWARAIAQPTGPPFHMARIDTKADGWNMGCRYGQMRMRKIQTRNAPAFSVQAKARSVLVKLPLLPSVSLPAATISSDLLFCCCVARECVSV